jgi:hypothetical protein
MPRLTDLNAALAAEHRRQLLADAAEFRRALPAGRRRSRNRLRRPIALRPSTIFGPLPSCAEKCS